MRLCFTSYGALGTLIFVLGCGSDPSTVRPEGPDHTPSKPPPPQSQPLPGGEMPDPGPITGMPMTGQTLDAKFLVLSADGTEADLATIRQALAYLGTPYTLWIANKSPGTLTPSVLASGKHGFFQGVITTTANLSTGANGASALTAEEWKALYNYEASFGVRQVNWYSYPTTSLGFSSMPVQKDTTTSPIQVTLTPAGQTVFPYVNKANALTIDSVFAYLAKPAADPQVTPLFVDGSGNAVVIEQKFPDGRDFLTVTMDSDPGRQPPGRLNLRVVFQAWLAV